MKQIIFSFLLLSIGLISFAQSSIEKSISFAKEDILEGEYIYCDKELINACNTPWPAVGIYALNTSYYYTCLSDPYPDPSAIRIIHEETFRAAFHYSEYFIYGSNQKLMYYIYQSTVVNEEKADSIEIIMKFTAAGMESYSEYNSEYISDNYFFYEEGVLKEKAIRDRSDRMLNSALDKYNICQIETTLTHIREVYKTTNTNPDITTKQKNEATAYYNNNELVKININNDRNKEFYLENGRLVFAFYPETSSEKALRVYFCSSGPFKVILGDETMYTSDYTDFKELVFAVYEDFENAFRSITGD